MKHTILFLLSITLVAAAIAQEPYSVPDYYAQSDYISSTPGTYFGSNGFLFNPAVLGLHQGGEFSFFWSDLDREILQKDKWTLTSKLGNLGFSAQHWIFDIPNSYGGTSKKSFTDYTLALGFGDKAHSFGLGYSWSRGYVTADDPRDNVISIGSISRPIKYLSFGFANHISINQGDVRALFDLGFRPFGDPKLTLFGDAMWMNYDFDEKVYWGGGLAIEAIPGIALYGKYFRNETFHFGLTFNFGNLGLTSSAHYDDNSNQTYNTYGVSLGMVKPSVVTAKMNDNKYFVKANFDKTVKYQKYIFFDSGRTLIGILDLLEEVKNDNRVAGVALRITEEMYASYEMIWEIREKIKEVQAEGKKVLVFLERGGMRQYYLASIGDEVMVDPECLLMMQGFNLGRTFYKNLADKLGVGIDEWRYFEYKSAFESFSRTNMSEADKEQRKALVDGWYDTYRNDVCESRNLSESEFDYIINEVAILLADSVVHYNLADTTGRWDDMCEWVKSMENEDGSLFSKKCRPIGEHTYNTLRYQDARWGIPPKIAVIYAIGECALNTGINARRLQKEIKKAREDKSIKAVVFRADSPGGDILPSDIVAVELKKTAEKKPVIVSQGRVAASGGYWISTYGDKIVASPWTVTASIGVIGGWVYNNGFGDKIGLTYDHTQAGKHADVGPGISIPLIGVIPDRNLTLEERAIIERMIKAYYKSFVAKVADARGMEYDEVEEIAQGRVWNGIVGKQLGLIDELGGLETAIDLAKEAAGITLEEEVEIVEMPEKGAFNFEMLQSSSIGFKSILFPQGFSDPRTVYLKMLWEHNGKPLVMLPPEYYMIED